MEAHRSSWSLLLATVVIVIGIQQGTARNAPIVTVSSETPKKGDVFKIYCSCDVHPSKDIWKTEMSFKTDYYGSIWGHLYWFGGLREWKPKIHNHITEGTAGEVMTSIVSDKKLELNVTVKLTCDFRIDYTCYCWDNETTTKKKVKKCLNIAGCKDRGHGWNCK